MFNGAHQRVDFSGALGIVVEGLLQSPHFLFRKELGGAPDRSGQSHVAPYEMASLLSYSVWRSTPDAALPVHLAK